ncbi:hypothetical protein [Lewinella sp. IMCC34183]|uniref:hypothetical protein n=1 Tax=Lewinella sp. IMCC34183 TaxID=2248762 RepID=UPI000E2361F7|nr:hypothetical protein [Lewinella sp. IMCC34183]
MQPFLHARQQQLTGYLDRLVALDRAYAAKEYGVDDRCEALLGELLDYFADAASAGDRAAVGQLIAYLATARDGTDPETLVPVRTHRRAGVRRAVYHLLSRLTERLTGALDRDRERLAESRQLLGQALLSARQLGVVSEAGLVAAAASDAGAAAVWEALLGDERHQHVARRALLNLHLQDVHLLLGELARHFT